MRKYATYILYAAAGISVATTPVVGSEPGTPAPSSRIGHHDTPVAMVASARVESTELPRTLIRLPFTIDTLSEQITRLIKKTPKRARDGSLVFNSALEEHPVRAVILSDGFSILLRFWVQDEYGMDLVRQFCRSPLFEADEEELLVELLFAGPGMHWADGRRFDILCDYEFGPDATVISFFFSPPVRII